MSPRQRWWCSYCGQLTERHPSPDGRVRCWTHSALPPETDLIPPDPAAILPRMAYGLTCVACDGTGEQYPGLECPNCSGIGHHPGRAPEALSPTEGMEA